MTYRFTLETDIRASVDRVFALSCDIDAHVGSMAASSEQAVGGVTSGQIGLGEDVTWRARHFGVWWTMTSRITEWDAPHRFVDGQHRGPFKRFRHEHRFEPTDSGCRMTDEIELQGPLGPLGRFAEVTFLGRYLQHLIRERNAYLKAEAEHD